MDPEAYGLDKAIRPRIKKLRQRRNHALHGTRRHLQPSLKDEAVDIKEAVETNTNGTSTGASTHEDLKTSNDTTSSHASSNEAVAMEPSVYGGPFCVRCSTPTRGPGRNSVKDVRSVRALWARVKASYKLGAGDEIVWRRLGIIN